MEDETRKKRQSRNNLRLVWLLIAVALFSMVITMMKGASLFEGGS